MERRVSIASSPQDLADFTDLVAIGEMFQVLRYPRTGPRLRPDGRMA